MKFFNLATLLFSIIILTSCSDDKTITPAVSVTYPEKAGVTKKDLLTTTTDGVKVFNGGYGSGIASNEEGVYYIMTDRGANIDGVNSDEKIFAAPNFNPQIGKFKLVGDSLVLQSLISLKDEAGVALTGLPNPEGLGGAGEKAFDLTGKTLSTDTKGVDSEGLLVMNDGTFWVSDEYGPHIIHFDASGKTLERINPFGNGVGGRKIPSVFAKRRPNRGIEGLTVTSDQKYLVGVMQSPLYNPDKKVKGTAKAVRILQYEIATGVSKEFLYILESTDNANSDIVAITNTTFLVLERDGLMPGTDPVCFKKIYKIDISNATDISVTAPEGKLIGTKTIEQSTPEEISTAGFKSVTKELAFDIMSIPNYPHDKPEGIVIINNTTIGIINDDDFGVVGVGKYTQKSLPLMNNQPDKSILYFAKLGKSLK
ncbi:MAG: esterase-like activity of phytase family protein [Candidatus Kapabacteria bacterium]|nr:esterase-like activity of phytase family protein [Candidatus Kapabacteria bacterium]